MLKIGRIHHDTLTDAEDVEAEAMVNRLVDQLVWHAVKANMAREWYSTCSLSLPKKKKENLIQVNFHYKVQYIRFSLLVTLT